MTGNIDTGAATLEQQLAKDLYFPKNDGLFSKVDDAELALRLDAHYSKNDILRMYLVRCILATVSTVCRRPAATSA